MPYLTVVIPRVPAEYKSDLLSRWPSIAAEVKGQPSVAGVSGGEIAVQNGKKLGPDEFGFMETVAYANKEDWQQFKDSAWAKEQRVKYADSPPIVATYELSAFPEGAKPKAYTQFTLLLPKAGESIDIEAATGAWKEIMVAMGKDAEGLVGGVSVETESVEGEALGGGIAEKGVVMGMMGWEGIDEGREASEKADVRSAWQAFGALGREVRSVLVKLEVM